MEKFIQKTVARRQASLRERVAEATKQAPLTTKIRQVETERLIKNRFQPVIVYQANEE